MSADRATAPDSCTQCPHLDQFHGACGHPLRQAIRRELEVDRADCPLFGEIRAAAMQDLATRLEDETRVE